MISDIKTILVPTDFSAGSKLAFEYALTLAASLGATLEMVHITERPHYLKTDTKLQKEGEEAKPIHEFIEQQANLSMKNFIKHLPSHEKVTVKETVLCGSPYEELLKYADSKENVMIVMGTHGRTGVAHMLLGSIAEKIVRHASCPVLTIRHPEMDPRKKYEGKQHGGYHGTDFSSSGYMSEHPKI